jgi:tRNA-uridine 2-sulfurtransferase
MSISLAKSGSVPYFQLVSTAATRVIVGLSGGVDSAVAALLLRQSGYDVQALYMDNWDADDEYCTAAQDYQDARATARELGIVLHRVSFAADYRRQVFEEFLAEYRAGRTPNPDVLCNREIKFGRCLDYVRRLGGRYFATGHYARLSQGADGPVLRKALDIEKDQSYFLHAVPCALFADVLLPLGELTKSAVREQARRAGLPVFDKPDSTGICFIGERPFAEFLARYVVESPGPIETMAGQRLGTHRGLPFYTLGQRGGLEIGGTRGHAAEPWYVARKDLARNALIVVQQHEQAALNCSALRTGPVNWLCGPGDRPENRGSASSTHSPIVVKIRYRQPDQTCTVQPAAHSGLLIRFAEPQRAATAGQYAVLYAEERCLGGAKIAETL